MSEGLQEVFDALRAVMGPVAETLDVKHDEPGNYYVDTFYTRKNKQRMWFGGVMIKKNYVSYHLMPIYVNPSLLEDISPELKKRMQGKSCFNFRKIDKPLFKELTVLTKCGYKDYKEKGLLKGTE